MVRDTMEHILQVTPVDRPGYAVSLKRAALHVRMGGLNLSAIAPEAQGAYVAAFAAAAQELHGRLLRLPVNPFVRAVAGDINTVPPTRVWADGLRTARDSLRPLL